MTWFNLNDLSVELKIFVKPNAKCTRFIEIHHEQGVIIALHAKPKDGEANQELIRFLSEWLEFPKSAAKLLNGEKSRHKKIRVPLNQKVKMLLEMASTR